MARETLASLNEELGRMRMSNGSLQRDNKYLKECRDHADTRTRAVQDELRLVKAQAEELKTELRTVKTTIRHLTTAIDCVVPTGRTSGY